MAIASKPLERLYTASDLERLSDQGLRYELIEGELREMAPSGPTHGGTSSRVSYYVNEYVYNNGLGETFASETGFLLSGDPDTVLAPDFAFIRQERIPDAYPEGFCAIVPDLVVETRSPGDTKREIELKMRRWIDAGVRLAWDIDPMVHTVTVYQPGEQPAIRGVADTLAGGDVLPGFSLPVRKVFRETATERDTKNG